MHGPPRSVSRREDAVNLGLTALTRLRALKKCFVTLSNFSFHFYYWTSVLESQFHGFWVSVSWFQLSTVSVFPLLSRRRPLDRTEFTTSSSVQKAKSVTMFHCFTVSVSLAAASVLPQLPRGPSSVNRFPVGFLCLSAPSPQCCSISAAQVPSAVQPRPPMIIRPIVRGSLAFPSATAPSPCPALCAPQPDCHGTRPCPRPSRVQIDQ